MSRTKSDIDPGIIRELAELLAQTDLTEIEVQQADLRIRVARQVTVNATVPVAAAAPIPVLAAPVVAAPVAVPASDPALHPGVLKSPMVGTVYLASGPTTKPFVEVGSVVKAGEKVMIVEAMKTFNDIVAQKSGTVTAILIEDKQPVEYGEPLLIIE